MNSFPFLIYFTYILQVYRLLYIFIKVIDFLIYHLVLFCTKTLNLDNLSWVLLVLVYKYLPQNYLMQLYAKNWDMISKRA